MLIYVYRLDPKLYEAVLAQSGYYWTNVQSCYMDQHSNPSSMTVEMSSLAGGELIVHQCSRLSTSFGRTVPHA